MMLIRKAEDAVFFGLKFICGAAFAVMCSFAQSVAKMPPLEIGGTPVELSLTKVNEKTLRVSFTPLDSSLTAQPVPSEPVLVDRNWPDPSYVSRSALEGYSDVFRMGGNSVRVTTAPLALRVEDSQGELRQEIRIDAQSGSLSFALGEHPLFGLGMGGPQFNRRGHAYPMVNRHGAYQLRTFAGRMPIPWLVSAAGWGLFFHRPEGRIDLSRESGKFTPQPEADLLPLDFFIVLGQPTELMSEYADLTGHPSMPPLWALGYQQSHRTLKDFAEVLWVAESFREKKLPCDALIYLGTGWCPSGWNLGHDSLEFNPHVFSNPKEQIQTLKQLNFRVVLHATFPPRRLYGSVHDQSGKPDDHAVRHYWSRHRPFYPLGIDGWWPDAGENLPVQSRLARIQMYWEGPQVERPNQRPYALHRTGYAGMQRHGGWTWSGDHESTWQTLRNQLPIALNTGLSGVPYWGTDIGGFYPTKEYTAELYLRWFQFMSFSPLFRAHGRTWYTHLPWGWNTGVLGPDEMEQRSPEGKTPIQVSQLSNPTVEPICRKYLELRYRMLPYIYSAAREATDTGMPLMRPLWLHYSDDPRGVLRDDEYLWGRDILVAPVFEKGATSREVYLPEGHWYDFWTREKLQGGREVTRDVDLETTPLYVRSGAIIPTGPVKQYTAEEVNGPITLSVYPGSDGTASVYEDDGMTFDFREGEFMRLQCDWRDEEKRLDLRLAPGSRLLQPSRQIRVRLVTTGESRLIEFRGQAVSIEFE
ncbi:DUF5110 domain-containing protein [Acidobacteria bacterium AH-259-G07]|nr:DUF5110 domain-containing protein [Acidobacteria bacterium AH-259-G07]